MFIIFNFIAVRVYGIVAMLYLYKYMQSPWSIRVEFTSPNWTSIGFSFILLTVNLNVTRLLSSTDYSK